MDEEKNGLTLKSGLRREIGDTGEDKRRRRKITGEKERNVMEKKDWRRRAQRFGGGGREWRRSKIGSLRKCE